MMNGAVLSGPGHRRHQLRHRRDQRLRIRMPWRPQHGGDRALFHQLAPLQHRNAVRDVRHHAEVMRDEQHRRPVLPLQFPDQMEDLRLCRHVQRRRRLVGNQQFRVQRQRHRDHRPLPLPAAELMRKRPHQTRRIRQVHAVQQLDDPRPSRRRPELGVDAQHLGDLPPDPVQRVQRRHRLLKDHRDPRPAGCPHRRRGRRHQVLPLEQDRACPDNHPLRQ